MALLASELARLKYELGYNLLKIGAEPYIGIALIFEQVIQPYLQSGAATEATATIAAAEVPTLATITLASVDGISVGDHVIVDVDAQQERATVRRVVGSTIELLLQKAHTGTFPVTVEGGEAIVRSILQRLQAISGLGADSSGEAGAMGAAISTAGLKKVDEIEFYGAGGGSGSKATGQLAELMRLREYWRDELASALGIVRLNGSAASGGGNVSVY